MPMMSRLQAEEAPTSLARRHWVDSFRLIYILNTENKVLWAMPSPHKDPREACTTHET